MLKMAGTLAAAFSLSAFDAAWAGEVVVNIVDASGRAVQDAVVSVMPAAAGNPGDVAGMPPANAIIDQKNETFIPLVTITRMGGQIVFRNSDTTRHHVYSFSPVKQFQFLLNPGDQSPPVIFEKAGIAAVGCNIHDHMIAYVYVAASAWTGRSGASGNVRFESVPSGKAVLEVWHPALLPGAPPPTETLDVGAGTVSASIKLGLRTPAPMNPHRAMDY